MLRAADEGIRNITMLLQDKNLLDDTIIIFTTDNGGQTAKGSNNWPLRGNKATVFEGGVCGTGFVWGSKLPKSSTNPCNRLVTDNSRRHCWFRTG